MEHFHSANIFELAEKYYYDEWGVETETLRYGDITGDGEVNINDYSLMKRLILLSDTELTAEQKIVSDLNGDGTTNVAIVGATGAYGKGVANSIAPTISKVINSGTEQIPQSIIDHANNLDIIIRDIEGKVYNK